MMRNLLIILMLLSFTKVNAQQNFPIHESFIDVFNNNTRLPIMCVDRSYDKIVGVALDKKKFQSLTPNQSVGNLIVFEKDLDMGMPDRWQFTIGGNACAFDIIRTKANHTIVVGAFVDSIKINQQVINANAFHLSPFVIAIDSMGNLKWIKTDDELNTNNIANSIDEDDEGDLVVIGLKNDVSTFICKYDSENGDTLLYKVFDDVRTFSSIQSIADHYYVAGTIDDFGSLDTFRVHHEGKTGYGTFLTKLDKQFNVKWLSSKPYITFDFYSNLEYAYNHSTLLWANYSVDSSLGVVQNLCIIDTNKNILKEQNYALQFSSSDFENKLIERSDLNPNSFHFIKENNKDYYLYWFGTDGVIDSILIFNNSDIELFDFEGENLLALAGLLKGDTLRSINALLPNVNADSNQYMNFIAYYFQAVLLNTNDELHNEILIYPNPVEDKIQINSTEVNEIIILDLSGREVRSIKNNNYIEVDDLDTGMYIVKINIAGRYLNQKVFKR